MKPFVLAPLVLLYIQELPVGQRIHLKALYATFYSRFPVEFRSLGDTGQQRVEPRWRYEVRSGLKLAQHQKLVKPVGTRRSGEWRRI
jgi:hypothetical protein